MDDVKLILRRLFRERVYSFINLVGLVMAFTVVLLLYSHVAKEFRMDKYHRNGKNIYRIIIKVEEREMAHNLNPTAPTAKKEIPGVADYTRIALLGGYYVKAGENGNFVPGNSCMSADFSFFRLFTVPIVSGVVEEGNGKDIVISRKMARRYFGDKNPVGQQIMAKGRDNDGDGDKYTVVAVMEDFPGNSTIQADMIMRSVGKDHWQMAGVYSFLLLDPKADVAAVGKAVPEMVERHAPGIIVKHEVRLQPLEDIYFSSGAIVDDNLLHGNKKQTLTLCGVGLLILLLASCNYILIRIARLNRKLGEFAVQRCYGAGNRLLFRQLFLETGVFTLLALLPSLLFAYWLHPSFIRIVSSAHVYALHLTFAEILVFVAILAAWVSVMGGILYASVARKLDREGVKNSTGTVSRGFDMKKVLTFVQMVIFSALIFCSVVFAGQMDYLKNKPLGFDNRNTINFNWKSSFGFERKSSLSPYEELQERLLGNPAILAVSNGYSLPFQDREQRELQLSLSGNADRKVKSLMIIGDASYMDTYCIRLLQGRSINRESYSRNPMDFHNYRPEQFREVLVNKKFAEQMELSDPVGRIVVDDHYKFKIVGVVDDFHFYSFNTAISPVVIVYDVAMSTGSVIVRYHPDKKREAVAYIKELFEEKFPGTSFNYSEYDYTVFYQRDLSFVKAVNILTLIAVLIGGMGMFAFSMFMVEVRRKEIGMRKINGATEREVVRLLGGVFVRQVLLACAVGLPLAYFAMREWLRGYAYRIGINVWMFLVVVIVSLLLVSVITGWQLRKAARTNPVDSLKSE